MLTDFIRRAKRSVSSSILVKRLNLNSSIKIGKKAHILTKTSVNCGKNGSILIGDETFINEFCSIYAHENTIKIGKGVLIGPATVINTFNHNFQDTNVPIQQQGINDNPIVIEDDVWIGAHCTILGGVTIGAHSVVGAHSLVNKSIPPYSVAYGVPCKVVRTRK